MLETTRGEYRHELAHVFRIKPYYDRKTVLLESGHESKISDSSDEDFVSFGRTMTFESRVTNPATSTSNVRRIAPPPPDTVTTPWLSLTPAKNPQQALDVPGSTLHAKAALLESSLENPLLVTHMDDDNLR